MSTEKIPRLEVCLSPWLLPLFHTGDSIIVIIDVFRATSTIAAVLDNGAAKVIPVASVEECVALGRKEPNSLTAGERDGKVAPGLSYGNSPLEYPAPFVKGKTVILTTTNGTRLLHLIQASDSIITGSFLNLSAICNHLITSRKNVLLACAGWKNRFNLEDTLFAGAVVNRVQNHFSINCDSARAARSLFNQAQGDLLGFLKDSAHYSRLAAFGHMQDMEYCTTPDLHQVVPVLRGKELIKLTI